MPPLSLTTRAQLSLCRRARRRVDDVAHAPSTTLSAPLQTSRAARRRRCGSRAGSRARSRPSRRSRPGSARPRAPARKRRGSGRGLSFIPGGARLRVAAVAPKPRARRAPRHRVEAEREVEPDARPLGARVRLDQLGRPLGEEARRVAGPPVVDPLARAAALAARARVHEVVERERRLVARAHAEARRRDAVVREVERVRLVRRVVGVPVRRERGLSFIPDGPDPPSVLRPEQPKERVEAALGRPVAPVAVAQVPLADEVRRVPALAQPARERRHVGRERPRARRRDVGPPHPEPRPVQSGGRGARACTSSPNSTCARATSARWARARSTAAARRSARRRAAAREARPRAERRFLTNRGWRRRPRGRPYAA